MSSKLISVVIPVFRNEGSIYGTYISLKSMFAELGDNYHHEMIFINDGSDDRSIDELIKLKTLDNSVHVIDFTRNFGQVSAIHAGFKKAQGDVVVNISADLQDPPDLILEMIKKWELGFKIVLCTRGEREDNIVARLTSSIFYRLIKNSIPSMPRGGFDYFLLDRIVYKQIYGFDERNSFMQGDILWTGYDPYFIEYKRLKRTIGKSQWTIWKKVKYFIDGIINTSYAPIRLMSLVGIATSVLGFLYSIAILFSWLYHHTPFEGYAPIMMGMLIISGVTMIMLGVIGEYLWRIYDEVRKRPRYLIKDQHIQNEEQL